MDGHTLDATFCAVHRARAGRIVTKASSWTTCRANLVRSAQDDAISPIYNEWHLRRAAPYLGGIESELLSLNKIVRI